MSAPEHVGSAAAFCPAHVTGFFQIHDGHPDPLRHGSRGAGICLDVGSAAHAIVTRAPEQRIDVFINGGPARADVTTAAARELVGKARVHVLVRTEQSLPEQQGFGTSAAGALSAGLAIAKAIGLGRYEAVRAAHLAELRHKTGLGDVAAALHGGVEFRREPGLPPYGRVDKLAADGQFVLLPLGGGMETQAVLADTRKRERIAAAAARALQAFEAQTTLPNLFRVSRRFATDAGLTPPEVERALAAAEEAEGLAFQAMLGTSVVAYGDTRRLEDALRPFGTPLVCGVDPGGARLVTAVVTGREPETA